MCLNSLRKNLNFQVVLTKTKKCIISSDETKE